MRHLAWLLLATIFPVTPIDAQTLTLRAGRLLQCTLEEPSLSSKTAAPGEPVRRYLRSAREFGRSAFPRGSYLAGRFSDSREPGRIAGKGWMKLEFDRLILPDTDISIATKVVAIRCFRVDEEGKILGQGHPKRNAFAWFVPILWPIDLIRLPPAVLALHYPAKSRWSFASWMTWTFPARPTHLAAAPLHSRSSRARVGRLAAIKIKIPADFPSAGSYCRGQRAKQKLFELLLSSGADNKAANHLLAQIRQTFESTFPGTHCRFNTALSFL